MADSRAFVYVVCGTATHIRTLHRSLEHLRPHTRYPIIVVTDRRRNEIPIEHTTVVDVDVPRHLSDHQASIFLKTSLHRILPSGDLYVYLDTDVIAADPGVDAIFEEARGPVTFAHDLTRLENRVATFSPWAVRCGCPTDQGLACSHLSEAIANKFHVRVPDDWLHWNGGVFLFGPASSAFMDTWHRLTLDIFDDPYWKTRDQGTLIATAWMMGLQDQRCLPAQFDFIVDDNNPDLCFDRRTGYALHASIPGIHPSFLHLYHADLDRPGWRLSDVQDPLEARTQARAFSSPVRTQKAARSPESESRPQSNAPGDVRSAGRAPYQVIVGVALWQPGPLCDFAQDLVRGLIASGTDAHVLLTDRDSMAPDTSAAPVVELPAERDASWGTRWGTLVHYLEDRAPCIYVPLNDLTHSNISPHLSDRVAVVGIVPDIDPRYLDQVERLGRYWNAIVCLHADVAQLVAERHADMADRIVHVAPESTEAGFTALFGEIMAPNQARPFHRPKGLLRKPPYRVAGSDVFPILYFRGVRDVGVFPSYREDYDDYRRASGAPLATTLPEWRPELARMYPVIVGASVVADPVADPFVAAVTRGLQKADHPVQVLVASGARVAVQSGRFGKNSPVFDVPSGAMFWRTSERALVKYIERRAPCLFLPGGEPMFSDILPRLSQEVGVIARVDDLSPATLDRVRATGRYWRAVVAASPAIAAGLLEAVPSLSSRLVTIPLGIEIPDRLTERALSWQTPLKVVVAGAATDIANIADALAVGGVSVEVATAGDPTAAAFEGRDVIVVCGDAENYRVHVQQAMGRGCVPVIVSGNQAAANLVKDGETGYRVADNDMAALVGRLDALQKNPALCRAIAVRAFRFARNLADDLAVSHMMLFERVLREIEFAPTTRKGRRDEHG